MGGPASTCPVSSENTPSCQGQTTTHFAASTVPSDRLARAWVQRFAIAWIVPPTLNSATASAAAYTRLLVPGGRSAASHTGVNPSPRVAGATDRVALAPPNVSRRSHSDICTHVRVGVSRSV